MIKNKKLFRSSLSFFRIILLLLLLLPLGSSEHLGDIKEVGLVSSQSAVDAAIGLALTRNLGMPIFYTGRDELDRAVLDALETDYKGARVVILGGPMAISPIVEDSLKANGREVIRLAGATGTGTAITALNYFYGPAAPGTAVPGDVWLVRYPGDDSSIKQEELLYASQLARGPIIPIGPFGEELPADVLGTLIDLGIKRVALVGHLPIEARNNLDVARITVDKELDGTVASLKGEVERKVINEGSLVVERGVVLAQEGNMPPLVPWKNAFIVRDWSNDGVEDDIKDEISLLKLSAGTNVDVITLGTPDLAFVKQSLSAKGINLIIHESPTQAPLALFMRESSKLEDYYAVQSNIRASHLVASESSFNARLPELKKQFASFYVRKRAQFSPELILEGARALHEASKGNALSSWRLMNAFTSDYWNYEFIRSCQTTTGCPSAAVAAERISISEEFARFVKTRSTPLTAHAIDETAALVHEAAAFAPPGGEGLADEISPLLSSRSSSEDLRQAIIKQRNNEAYHIYAQELDQEAAALGKGSQSGILTPESFEKRVELESQAIVTGLVDSQTSRDPVGRAKTYATLEAVNDVLDASGIDVSYLSASDLKQANIEYSKSGKLSGESVPRLQAASTAYRTWENSNLGSVEESALASETWDASTGSFSFTVEGNTVQGVYNANDKTYSYVDDGGLLVIGDENGNTEKHDSSSAPAGWSRNSDTGSWSKFESGKTLTYGVPQSSSGITASNKRSGSSGGSVGIITPTNPATAVPGSASSASASVQDGGASTSSSGKNIGVTGAVISAGESVISQVRAWIIHFFGK